MVAISLKAPAMISTPCIISSSVMTRGGAKRMMFTCVGLANNPLDLSNKQSSQALRSDLD